MTTTTLNEPTLEEALALAEAEHSSANTELQRAMQTYSAARKAKDINGMAAARTRQESARDLVADAQAKVDAATSAIRQANAANKQQAFLDRAASVAKRMFAEWDAVVALREELANHVERLAPQIRAAKVARNELRGDLLNLQRQYASEYGGAMLTNDITYNMQDTLRFPSTPMAWDDPPLGDPEDFHELGKVVDAICETRMERLARRNNNQAIVL